MNYMEIILMRHGIAVQSSEGLEDSDRRLTEKGVSGIFEAGLKLRERVHIDEGIIIWTSPTKRTLQTAEIIAEELGITDITKYDFIQTGDYRLLEEQIKSAREKSTVIIVGHEPFLGMWSEYLSGKKIPFKKGSIAVFHLRNADSLTGKLIWTFHPGRINKGKQDSRHLSFEDYQEVLLNHIDEITACKDIFLETPDVPESVHELRVKIRQFRSILSFLSPFLDKAEYQKYKEDMRDMMRRFSRIREIDVAWEEWTGILQKNAVFLQDRNELKDALLKERNDEKAQLISDITNGLVGGNLRAVSEWILSWDEQSLENRKIEKGIKKRFLQWNKKAANNLKRVDPDNVRELHPLRIRFKKIRYVQMTLPYFTKHERFSLKDLKILQDKIGRICDVNIAVSTITSILKGNDTPGLNYEIGIYNGYKLSQREYLIVELKENSY